MIDSLFSIPKPIVYSCRNNLKSISCLGWPLVCVSKPQDMGHWLSLSLSLSLSHHMLLWIQISWLESSVSRNIKFLPSLCLCLCCGQLKLVTWEHWPGWCRGRGLIMTIVSPRHSSARVSFSEKPWLSFSHNNPPSHYTSGHCLPRIDDGDIWLAINVSSVPRCTCAAPVFRLRMSPPP